MVRLWSVGQVKVSWRSSPKCAMCAKYVQSLLYKCKGNQFNVKVYTKPVYRTSVHKTSVRMWRGSLARSVAASTLCLFSCGNLHSKVIKFSDISKYLALSEPYEEWLLNSIIFCVRLQKLACCRRQSRGEPRASWELPGGDCQTCHQDRRRWREGNVSLKPW